MKKVLSLLLGLAMTLTVMLVVVPPIEVEAISINPVNVKGSYYTDSPALAEMLDIVFSGDIDIYRTSDSTEVSMPIGKNMSKTTEYYPKNYRGYTGYQCYAYANAVYNKLFKEIVGHGTSSPNSKTVISGGSNTASFEMFSNAKVRCGAYMRTTNYANGSYNGNAGHSMIILSYNETYITYVGGNQDANGIVDVRRETWAEFNAAHISGRGRYISHVVQPKDSYYDSLYPSSPKSTLTIYYHANGGNIVAPVAIGTNYRVDTTNGDWAYARSGPGTNYSQIDGFAPGSTVAVIETKKMSDYTWGKIKYGKEAWVALGDWMTPVGTAYDHFYYIDPPSSIIANINNNHIITSVLTYGQELKDGLYNNTTFKLYREGYNFLGWSLTADGSGTIIDQDKAIKPEEIVPEIANGDKTVTMYAIWEKIGCDHVWGTSYTSGGNSTINRGHWRTCTLCGEDEPIQACTPKTSYTYSKYVHWIDCTICNRQITNLEDHEYTNNCDTSCNTCGYTRTITHTYTNSCDTSCNVCGSTRTITHTYNHDCDTDCNVCCETRTTAHSYGSYSCDSDHHWKTCTICNSSVISQSHYYTNNCDTSCNACGYERTITHSYDNDCDTDCNVCGETRSTEHVYDDEQDTTCNVCSEVRTVETLPSNSDEAEPSTKPGDKPDTDDTQSSSNKKDNNNDEDDEDEDNDNTTIIVVAIAGAVAISTVSIFGTALVMKKKK